jgi:hypothetical protein
MSWEKLNAGPHTLAVTLEGYDVFAERVEVKDSNLTRVPKIVLQRSKGEIEVTTSAPATLTVAGPDNPLNPQPVPNPWKAEDMPTGEYRISIMRAGWQPILKTEKLKTGSPLRVRYDLSPGTLEIVNLAAGTMVTVNNKLAGQVPAGAKSLKVQDVQPGEVEYLLELNGTKKTGKAMIVAGQPEVADGKLSTVTATPAPKPPAQQQQQQQQPRRAPDEPSSRREWMKWIPGA